MFIGRVLELNGDITYNKYKESTYSKMWMPQVKLNVPKDTAYSVGRQSRLFYWSFSVNKPPVQLGVGKKYFSIRNKPPVLI